MSASHFRCGHPQTPENSYHRRDRPTPRCRACQRLDSQFYRKLMSPEKHAKYVSDAYRRVLKQRTLKALAGTQTSEAR